MLHKNFSSQINKLRTSYKLSMSEIGDLLGLSAAHIAMWEKGQRNPSHEIFIEIAEIFGVSLDWLVGMAEQKNCYNEKVVREKEELFVEAASQEFDTGSKYCALMDLSLMIKNRYSTVKQREKYSWPVRANLCYLFYCYIMYSGQLKALETDVQAYPAELGKDTKIDVQIKGLKQIKKVNRKKEEIKNYIIQLLSPDAEPIFDLTKVQ